ncbi:MAG: hypothetical protein V7704_03685 [Aurantimonas endophytica]|jgi:hypothetical protein|uniref:Uncharacterized protein n=1 Tax=Aurantimonas endophytica TaxID=1522175 RepID=A0A7W6HH55_9HYPH|nr:hypothetical protein [Aurantimonas endophytica]MBB4004906.1 hypothetical protein [Aurantimonas endophytica]MCO6405714.1 hypothetical protein [Aurantimonas endophytica]
MTRLLLATLLSASVLSGAAHAQAPACAAALPAEAKLIYDAVAAAPATGSLRDRVTAETKALVEAGQVKRMSARSSATAAGECLKDAG